MNQDFLLNHFKYDDVNGELLWTKPTSNRVAVGSIGGSSYPDGYKRINILGKRYQLHRLIWMYIHGSMPENIDHVNHIRDDNRISNLRSSTNSENMKNKTRYSSNKTGVTGVSKSFRKSKGKFYYFAFININGKQKQLKSSTKIEPCILARKQAEIKYGYHENHGKEKQNEYFHS